MMRMRNTRLGEVRMRTAAAVVLVCVCAVGVGLAAERPDADQVRAALVLNFTRYTEWPLPAEGGAGGDVLRIGILADEDQAASLVALDGKVSGERLLEVVRCRDAAAAADVDAVFVAGGDRETWLAVRAAVADRPILTIGEMNGFLDAGGLINLVNQDGRYRFEVNLADARDAGLKISSRLLKLARTVKQ